MTGHLPPLAAAALLGSFLLGGGTPAARAEGVDDDIKSFQDYLKTKPASDGLRNKIAELGLKKDPKVAKALLPLLNNPDFEVKIAVCQNVGKQGSLEVVGPLTSIFNVCEDIKEKERKPEETKLMGAALEGIGDANAKGSYEFLMKKGRKFIDTNGDLACSAFRAASNHVSNETVGDFIKELTKTSTADQKDGPAKKAARSAAQPVLIDLLGKMTGKPFKEVNLWQDWWNKNNKTWKPSVPGKEETKDVNASEEFKDDDYGFEIRKPNTRWTFRKPEGTSPYLILEALEEGQRAAWVELNVAGTKNLKSKTPDAMAEEWKGILEGKFRDFKTSEWAKKTTISGNKAVEHLLFGQHKDFDAVHMHNIFVENKGVMFMLFTHYKSGKTASLKDDIEQIIRSLKLTH